jgi:hypothetical protein
LLPLLLVHVFVRSFIRITRRVMLIHSLTHVIAGMSHDLIESSVDLVKGYCVA